jgi:hypothetical protein
MTASLTRPLALAIGVAPTLLFFVGIPLHDGTPGTCDAWAGCTASAREQWMWTAQSWATAGVVLGVFIAAAARIAPWLRMRPVAVRRGSIAALAVLTAATCLFALVAVVVWNIDCSESAWICFGGPEDALALGSPGLVTAVLSVLLVVGLARRDTPAGRTLSTMTITGLAAGVVAVAAGLAAGGLLGVVADSSAGF